MLCYMSNVHIWSLFIMKIVLVNSELCCSILYKYVRIKTTFIQSDFILFAENMLTINFNEQYPNTNAVYTDLNRKTNTYSRDI